MFFEYLRQFQGFYDAKKKAIVHFKPSKRQEHNVFVVLAEKDGEVVTQFV